MCVGLCWKTIGWWNTGLHVGVKIIVFMVYRFCRDTNGSVEFFAAPQKVPTLQHFARMTIRRRVPSTKIDMLFLPLRVKEYLKYKIWQHLWFIWWERRGGVVTVHTGRRLTLCGSEKGAIHPPKITPFYQLSMSPTDYKVLIFACLKPLFVSSWVREWTSSVFHCWSGWLWIGGRGKWILHYLSDVETKICSKPDVLRMGKTCLHSSQPAENATIPKYYIIFMFTRTKDLIFVMFKYTICLRCLKT